MRTMLKVSIPSSAGSRAFKDGSLSRTMMSFVEQYKPEGAWFAAENGQRTAFFVFDLKESNLLPSIAEPFFAALEAHVTMCPVMNLEDLKVGVEKAMKSGR